MKPITLAITLNNVALCIFYTQAPPSALTPWIINIWFAVAVSSSVLTQFFMQGGAKSHIAIIISLIFVGIIVGEDVLVSAVWRYSGFAP